MKITLFLVRTIQAFLLVSIGFTFCIFLYARTGQNRLSEKTCFNLCQSRLEETLTEYKGRLIKACDIACDYGDGCKEACLEGNLID